MIAWRRDFHANPELGNREFRTAGIVADHLRALGFAREFTLVSPPDDKSLFRYEMHTLPSEIGERVGIDSLPAVRAAAASLMTGLGALQGIYLGMFGFAKFVPETAELWMKALFLAPLLCWLTGLYECLKVAKTEELSIYRNSPEDIRRELGDLAKEKQRELDLAFYWMLGGLLAAFVLVALRMKM